MKLILSSPGRFYTGFLTYIYPINSPQMLRYLRNIAFECLIIKRLHNRETGCLLTSEVYFLHRRQKTGGHRTASICNFLHQVKALTTGQKCLSSKVLKISIHGQESKLNQLPNFSGQGRLVFP